MKYDHSDLEVLNVQYSKKILANGTTALDINGHIANEYYETTIVVPSIADENSVDFHKNLRDALLEARKKTLKLKEEL
jgi:hypothetical protein